MVAPSGLISSNSTKSFKFYFLSEYVKPVFLNIFINDNPVNEISVHRHNPVMKAKKTGNEESGSVSHDGKSGERI